MRRSTIEFTKFAVVGLASNGVLYVVYLLLTWVGIGPKTAMTLLFSIGTLQTFLFNKNWSFAYRKRDPGSFFRYVVVYFSAYCINLIALLVLVDHLGLRHEVVQAVTVLLLAAYLFGMQKFWVFRLSDQTTQTGQA